MVLRDGKDFTAPPVCVVGEEYFRSIGMLPWLDIQTLNEDRIGDRYVLNGWFPGNLLLGWMLGWDLCNPFACHDGDLFRLHRGSLINVRAELCENEIHGAKMF